MSKCPYAKKCSGCQLQNLTYEEQLKMKQVKLISLLGKYGHVSEIIGMENPYNYRNKAQSIFGFKIAENALFIIWQKIENNFSAREKVSVHSEKIRLCFSKKIRKAW